MQNEFMYTIFLNIGSCKYEEELIKSKFSLIFLFKSLIFRPKSYTVIY